jgi:hypothetical protein
LAAPTADLLWPHWQARITLQSASVSSVSLQGLADTGGMQRTFQGGGIFGDYYFANRSFGSFRASGGLMAGAIGGAPLAVTAPGPRLGLSLSGSNLPLAGVGLESLTTVPYLGLGFTGTRWLDGLSVTADIGIVAEHGPLAGGSRVAVFGSQAMDNAVRELRLSPVMQLGVRYTF